MKNLRKVLIVFVLLFTLFFTCDYSYKAAESDNKSATNELETYEPMTDNAGTTTCLNIFGNKNDKNSVAHILSEVYKLGKIAAVIMVIALTMIDFTKSIASSDSDAIKKSFNLFTKRLVILMALFLIPGFLKIIFDFTFGSGTMCSI